MKRCGTALCAALAASLLAASAVAANPGDIWAGSTSGVGGIVRVDGTTGAKQPIATGPPLECPTGGSFDRAGTFYIADYCAAGAVGASGDGAIFKITKAGVLSIAAENDALFQGPTDVVMGHDGFLYAVDLLAGPGANGAVFKIDPGTGATTMLPQDPKFNSGPLGIDVLPNGRLVVSDQDAGPGNSGAVFAVDPNSGVATVIAQGASLSGPYGLVLNADQRTASVAEPFLDSVVKVDLLTGAQTVIASGTTLNNALAVARGFDGRLFTSNAGVDNTIYSVLNGAVAPFASGAPLDGIEGLQTEPPTCGGKTATIFGSNGPDKLDGTSFPDVIAGLGGKDKVNALGKNDIVCGGKGKDTLKGGAGRDTLRGEAGRDNLNGGTGKDKLIGGKGRDNCAHGPGKADKEKGC